MFSFHRFECTKLAWLAAIAVMVINSMILTVAAQKQNLTYQCGSFDEALPPSVDCPSCSTSFALKTGFNVNLNCTIGKRTCIQFPKFNKSACIDELIFGGTYYQYKKPSESYFIGTIPGIKVVAGNRTVNLPKKTLSVTATHFAPLNLTAPFKFQNCTVDINDEQCKECTICTGSDGGVKFDCTNIVYTTLKNGTEVKFPKFEKCIGIPKYNRTTTTP